MQRFDCLAPDLELEGHYLLEASAGTGKTFAIEHIVSRLIMSGKMTIDEVLVVTFTRAATRDLRMRIKAALEGCVEEAIDPLFLEQALCEIDEAPIFTIHAFCQRMLTEHAFEAGVYLGEMDEKGVYAKQYILDYMRTGLKSETWSDAQKALLLKRGLDPLIRAAHALIERSNLPYLPSYSESVVQFNELGTEWQEEVLEFAPNYKGLCTRSGELHEKWRDLSLEGLITNNIFEKLSPENLKAKGKELRCELRERIMPIIEQAADVVTRLASEAQEFVKNAQEEAEVITPNDLLTKMQKALLLLSFKKAVSSKFKALIIDEFQDTDSVQWEIFQTLFNDIETMFLVGDPKQSIYSFRGADLYTYLGVADQIPNRRVLDTNYRSEPALVRELNRLFQGRWLTLPKLNTSLEYLPVKERAGITNSEFGDGLGPVNFWQSISEKPEDDFFPWICNEIEWLVHEKGFSYSSCAVLIRDRFQGERLRLYMQKRNIPLFVKKSEPLNKSEAFSLIRALLQATNNPFDRSSSMQVLASPLVIPPSKEELPKQLSHFHTYHEVFKKEGLSGVLTLFDSVDTHQLEAYSDMAQLTSLLLDHESNHLSSLLSLIAFLDSMSDSEEHMREPISDDDAVTIMTMHMSKGLEFDIVFPLGLATNSPKADEEQQAEKMRQFYVAMTRAKKRIYAPIVRRKKATPLGTESPIELWQSQTSSEPNIAEPKLYLRSGEKEKVALLPPPVLSLSFPHQKLLSFSALSQKHRNVFEEKPSLPAGSETGVVLHDIFEKLILFGRSDHETIARLVSQSRLKEYASEVISIIEASFSAPLGGFALKDIPFSKMLPEIEFLYPTQEGYLKGFIDLVFEWQDKYYILDWKSNYLGHDYKEASLEKAMHDGDYFLQAKIYATALKHYLKPLSFDKVFGGVYYLFLRGVPQGEGIFYHRPDCT